ncbi:MAG TPA: ATP-dependent helicase, partial [Telluria sp.]|nr:ATP-dependent helicase [Telluria sp.]
MSVAELQAAFDACTARQKTILALLALTGEPMGKSRVPAFLGLLGDDAPEDDIAADLAHLAACGLARELPSRGAIVQPDASWIAIEHVLKERRLSEFREVYGHVTPLRVDWQGAPMLRSYRQGMALLRMALVGGEGPKHVAPLLAACL